MPRAKHKPISLSSKAATSQAPAFALPAVRAARPAPIPDEEAAFRALPYQRGPSRHSTTAAAEQARLRMLAKAPGAAVAQTDAFPAESPDDAEPVPFVPMDPPAFFGESTREPDPLPTPTPEPEVAPILATPPTVEDIDRLWDWIRADGDGGAAFFSRAIPSSVALHNTFSALAVAEQAVGPVTAAIRAITSGPHHVGFAMLLPILRQERTALMHIYLRPELRGMLAQLTPTLIDQAAAAVPGFTLAVIGHDAALTRMHRSILAPLGFVEHTMFLRQP